ncbi:MAG: PLxRFG domain-containing protein [Lamprobacter sp.]|uniref:PLxRFG domain-containing protein n=1 Tax=Lamprobacter sp. TaxID=3100796 RepID=UPI002B2639A6|nr:PLxRFG domain-containing protein [Lamprobacter sp.]MEA3639920.1 PLxRFG domain-containing protein [Lamprobacter sp.]
MSLIDTLRERHADKIGDASDAEIVGFLSKTTGRDQALVALDLGLDATQYGQNQGLGGDMWTSLKKEAVNFVTEGVPGLIDMGASILTAPSRYAVGAVTGNEVEGFAPATRLAEGLADLTGLSGDAYEQRMDLQYSPEQQALNQRTAALDQSTGMNAFTGALGSALTGQGGFNEVQQAWNDLQLGEWLAHYGSNAGRIAPNLIAGSTPSLVAGLGAGGLVAKAGQAARGVIGQRAADTVSRLSPFAGEGLVMGGQQTGQLLKEGVHPDEAALAGGVTAVLGAGVGAAGGTLANRLGAGDVNQAFSRAGRDAAQDAAVREGRDMLSYGPRLVVGTGIEAGEELLQSGMEQTVSNIAQDKPFLQGVPSAMAQGTLAGAGMGAAFNLIPGGKPVDLMAGRDTQEGTPEVGQSPIEPQSPSPLVEIAGRAAPPVGQPSAQAQLPRPVEPSNLLGAPPQADVETSTARSEAPPTDPNKTSELADQLIDLANDPTSPVDPNKTLQRNNPSHVNYAVAKRIEHVSTLDDGALKAEARRKQASKSTWVRAIYDLELKRRGLTLDDETTSTTEDGEATSPLNAASQTRTTAPPTPPTGVTGATAPAPAAPQANTVAQPPPTPGPAARPRPVSFPAQPAPVATSGLFQSSDFTKRNKANVGAMKRLAMSAQGETDPARLQRALEESGHVLPTGDVSTSSASITKMIEAVQARIAALKASSPPTPAADPRARLQQIDQQRSEIAQRLQGVVEFLPEGQRETILNTLAHGQVRDGEKSSANHSQQMRKALEKLDAVSPTLRTLYEQSEALDQEATALRNALAQDDARQEDDAQALSELTGQAQVSDEAYVGDDVSGNEAYNAADETTAEAEAAAGELSFGTGKYLRGQVSEARREENKQRVSELVEGELDWSDQQAVRSLRAFAHDQMTDNNDPTGAWGEVYRRVSEELAIQGGGENKGSTAKIDRALKRAADVLDKIADLEAKPNTPANKTKIGLLREQVRDIQEAWRKSFAAEFGKSTGQDQEQTKGSGLKAPSLRKELTRYRRALAARRGVAESEVSFKEAAEAKPDDLASTSAVEQENRALAEWELQKAELDAIEKAATFSEAEETTFSTLWGQIVDARGGVPWSELSLRERADLRSRIESSSSYIDALLGAHGAYKNERIVDSEIGERPSTVQRGAAGASTETSRGEDTAAAKESGEADVSAEKPKPRVEVRTRRRRTAPSKEAPAAEGQSEGVASTRKERTSHDKAVIYAWHAAMPKTTDGKPAPLGDALRQLTTIKQSAPDDYAVLVDRLTGFKDQRLRNDEAQRLYSKLMAGESLVEASTDLDAAEPDGDTRYGHDQVANPTTREAFTQTIKDVLGIGSSWKLHVYDSAQDVPAEGQQGVDKGAYGWVVPDRNGVKHAHFILDRIESGTELGKFLHEVGAHVGLETILSPAQYDRLHSKIAEWAVEARLSADSGTMTQAQSIALRAWGRMSDATKGADPETKHSELIAYFVEEAVAAGVDPTALDMKSDLGRWFNTLWAAFKRALRRLGIKNIDSLTPQDVVDLAYGAAKLEMRGTQSAESTTTEGAPSGDLGRMQFGVNAPPAHVSALKDALDSALESGGKSSIKQLLGWMTLGQIAERFGDNHPALRTLASSFKSMEALAKRWLNRAEEIDRSWASLDKARTNLLNQVMQRATLAGYDPETGDRQASTHEEHEINRLWKQLEQMDRRVPNTAAKATDVYRAARDHFEEDLKAARDYVKSMNRESASPRTQELIKVLDKLGRQGKKPYFSLTRIGDFYTVGMSPEMAALDAKVQNDTATEAEVKRYREMRKKSEHYIQTAHKSQRAAIQHRKALERRGFVAYDNESTFKPGPSGQLLRPEMKQFEDLLSDIGLDSKVVNQLKAQYETMLISALPESHALKQSLKREGIYEDNADMRGKFAAAAQFRAHTLSRLTHLRDIQDATRELVTSGRGGDTEARALANEIQKRSELAFERYEGTGFVRGLTKLSYMGYLGASPAYMLLNLSQTPAITAPWLAARNGNRMPQTLGMLLKDMNRVRKAISLHTQGEVMVDFDPSKSDFTAQERRVINDLVDSGSLDFTITYDLGAVSAGKSDVLERTTRSLNAPTHAIEIMNRTATALSAYRIRYEQTQDHAKSLAFAREAVDTTQVDYSPSNAARHMQKLPIVGRDGAKLAFQFYRFQQAMTYLAVSTFKDAFWSKDPKVRREARSTMAWLSASLTATSGVFGLPFVAGGLSLASTIAAALGFGDEEDDIDLERSLKNFIHDNAGWAADYLNQGALDTLTGMAMGKRMGQGDLMNPFAYTRSGRDDTTEDTFKEMLFALAGAPVSNAVGMWDGAMSLAEGDVQNFMEKAVPLKMVRDLARAHELSTEGLTERDGDVILGPDQFTSLEKIYQLLGITPAKKSRYYERNSAIQGARMGVESAKKKLIADFHQADSGRERAQARKAITAFNQRNPHARITYKTLRRSTDRRRDNQRQRDATGVVINEQMRPYLDAGRFAQ